MNHFAMTPGLMIDAEVSYRREQLAVDLSGARRVRGWFGTRRRRGASCDELTLAA